MKKFIVSFMCTTDHLEISHQGLTQKESKKVIHDILFKEGMVPDGLTIETGELISLVDIVEVTEEEFTILSKYINEDIFG